MPEQYTITKKEEVFQLLKKKPNFALMSDDLLKKMIEKMKVLRYKKGDPIVTQGEVVDNFYIVIKGSASIHVDDKFIYDLEQSGDIIGEISFLTGDACSASVSAKNDLGLVVITYDFLSHLASIEFGFWLCRVLGEKLIRTLKIKSSKPKNSLVDDNEEPADTVDQQPEENKVKPYQIVRKQQVFDVLKQKRNFADMSDDLLRQLLEHMKIHRFKANQIVFMEGDTIKNFYVIMKGSVSMHMNNKHLYTLRRTGDLFGVANFVTELESKTTVFADTELGVGEISYDLFEKLKNIEFCLWLGRIIAKKVVHASKLVREKEAIKLVQQDKNESRAN